jgi:hypothetical protein
VRKYTKGNVQIGLQIWLLDQRHHGSWRVLHSTLEGSLSIDHVVQPVVLYIFEHVEEVDHNRPFELIVTCRIQGCVVGFLPNDVDALCIEQRCHYRETP